MVEGREQGRRALPPPMLWKEEQPYGRDKLEAEVLTTGEEYLSPSHQIIVNKPDDYSIHNCRQLR